VAGTVSPVYGVEAKRLLETSNAPIEEVAGLAGFGSVATLRHHFGRAAGLSPRAYREAFRQVLPAAR
jgi:AraC family transcriptional activator FtrA